MNSLIDLHTHTNYSDGDLSPDNVIQRAKNKNVSVLAITDHDTINGIKNVTDTSNIKFIPGIELTAKVTKGRMHILGYNIDINNKELNDKMSVLRDNSIKSALSIIEQLKKDYNIKFCYEDIHQLINANHNIGRPDIAKLLIKYGYAGTVAEAFDKYLIEARKKVLSTYKGLIYEECIDLIKRSNGLSVLAHPKSLELSEKEFLILLRDMIKSGLQGIEVYHSSHTKEETKYYLDIAKNYNLLISGGSDFHGESVKPDIEIGTGKNNNLMIKELSILKYIK